MVEYSKLNKEPIEVMYASRDNSEELVPSFIWKGQPYFLDECIRTHNNPWCAGADFPSHIHGYFMDMGYPLYVELVGDKTVNLYTEV